MAIQISSILSTVQCIVAHRDASAGEPLTFAEVLAANPEWTEQGGQQGEGSRENDVHANVPPTLVQALPDRQNGAVSEEALKG